MNELIKLIKQTKDLEEELQLLQEILENNNHDLMLKAAIDSEKLFLNVRDYLEASAEFSMQLAERFYEQEAEVMGIEIYERGDSLFIEIPLLLPFKKLKNLNLQNNPNQIEFLTTYEHCNAILNALRYVLHNYLKTHSINKEKYSNATYIYSNIYTNDYPKSYIPDNDNYEFKQITDLVCRNISLTDDGYEHIDFHYETRIGDRKCTILEVRPREMTIQ